ncbi:MAG: HAD family hydrolase [Anaerolineales bacterium]|nr:HAD family hydrolase [Anaerolineales bacterium]
MKPLLIFDLDGTLYQIDKAWVPAVQQTFSDYGAPDLPAEVFRGRIGQRSEEMIAWYQEYIPQGSMEDFLTDLRRKTSGRMAETDYLFPACRQTLQQLTGQVGSMVVCSNGIRSYVDLVLESHQIRSFFSGVYTADDGSKTKEGCIGKILEAYSHRPAVMVGDRNYDMLAAQANNIFSIGASYGYGSPEELYQADLLIGSITELPAAVEILVQRAASS